MNIGQAAQASGLSAKTIRYYEDTGLIPAAGRTRAGYRDYNEKEVHILRFIQHARRIGFSGQGVRQLLTLWQDRNRTSADVKALALAHVTGLERKLADLQTMRLTLQHLVAHCEGDDRPDCPILDDLAAQGTELPTKDVGPNLN